MLSRIQKCKFKKLAFKKPDFGGSHNDLVKGDMVEIYTKLTHNKTRRFGKIVQGLCPFHDERTPSFSMYPETHSSYCFGCGWQGDTIKFVIEHEKITFQEALDFIRNLK